MQDTDTVVLLKRLISQIHENYEQQPVFINASSLLSPFCEDGTDDWSDWEQKFSNIAILATQFNCKLALLSIYIRDPAQSFYQELIRGNKVPVSWDELSAAFQVKFPDYANIDIKIEKILNMHQLPHESVHIFSSDIRNLAKRSLPGWNGHKSNDFVKSRFINKLQPYLRIWVRNVSPSTSEQAAELAHKYEINLVYKLLSHFHH